MLHFRDLAWQRCPLTRWPVLIGILDSDPVSHCSPKVMNWMAAEAVESPRHHVPKTSRVRGQYHV